MLIVFLCMEYTLLYMRVCARCKVKTRANEWNVKLASVFYCECGRGSIARSVVKGERLKAVGFWIPVFGFDLFKYYVQHCQHSLLVTRTA